MDDRFSNDDLKKALEVLKSGGIILYPTDTVWGIGCDATNAEAVEKIVKLKKRPANKQMLMLVDHPSRLAAYMKEVPTLAWDLIELSTKPLTIIYPGAYKLAQNLIAPDGTIAIRVTRELFSQTLCSRLRKPIVSTSANFSGQPAPRFFSEIDPDLIHQVDYAVLYRRDDREPHKPSGILKLGIGGEIQIIRE